jgi:hypothetical protein
MIQMIERFYDASFGCVVHITVSFLYFSSFSWLIVKIFVVLMYNGIVHNVSMSLDYVLYLL